MFFIDQMNTYRQRTKFEVGILSWFDTIVGRTFKQW